MGVICLRCGSCCRNMICLVPRNKDSNLTDKFLESLSFEDAQKYISDNAIEQGGKCPWLEQENFLREGGSNSIATCTAYNRRSSMCSNYPPEDTIGKVCNVGRSIWKAHKSRGYKIPVEIEELLKQDPNYDKHFKI